MRTLSSPAKRFALNLGLVVAGFIVAPAACFYPSYTYENGGAAGGNQGGSGGGGGVGGSASSSSNGEDCTNGIDDNGDGSVDCEDPGCGAFACVSEVPHEWSGFYALFEGPLGEVPACPEAFSTQDYSGNADLIVPDPGCPDCKCGPPTKQNCNLPQAQIRRSICGVNPFCTQVQDLTADGACIASNPLPAGAMTCGPPSGTTCPNSGQACNLAISVGSPTVTGGSCTPSQPAQPVELTWSKVALACRQPASAPIGGGCDGGQVCAPKVEAPYQTGICVKMPGDVACPALFPTKHVYYEGYADNRTCDKCTCATPIGSTCTTTIQFFTDTACTTSVKSVASGSCADLTGNPAVGGRKAVGTQITGGSCAASGGDVIGTALPDLPSTFCCK